MDTAPLRLLGYVRTGPLHWTPLTDMERALDTPLDDVVYGDTTDECLQQLKVKFPADDPSLTRVVLHSNHYYGEDPGADWSLNNYIEVLATQTYTGHNITKAIALCKRFTVAVDYRAHVDKHQDAWTKAGFVVPRWSYYRQSCLFVMKYDPPRLKRTAKARATRERKQPLGVGAFQEIRQEIYAQLIPFSFNLGYCGGKLANCVSPFLLAIRCFDFVFGDNAHRRLKNWEKLKQAWLEREPQTIQLLCNPVGKRDWEQNHDKSHYLPDRLLFVNWFLAELRARKVRVHRGKWRPLRKMPDLTRFKKGDPMAKLAKKTATKKVAKKAPKKAVKKKVAKKAAKKTAKKKAAKSAKTVKRPHKAPTAKITAGAAIAQPAILQTPEDAIVDRGPVNITGAAETIDAIVNGDFEEAPFDADGSVDSATPAGAAAE